jgi:hypothetical protein
MKLYVVDSLIGRLQKLGEDGGPKKLGASAKLRAWASMKLGSFERLEELSELRSVASAMLGAWASVKLAGSKRLEELSEL